MENGFHSKVRSQTELCGLQCVDLYNLLLKSRQSGFSSCISFYFISAHITRVLYAHHLYFGLVCREFCVVCRVLCRVSRTVVFPQILSSAEPSCAVPPCSPLPSGLLVPRVWPPGLLPDPPTLVTSEAGTSAAFAVQLRSQPTATVLVNVSSDNLNEVTANTSLLTFTAATWNVSPGTGQSWGGGPVEPPDFFQWRQPHRICRAPQSVSGLLLLFFD